MSLERIETFLQETEDGWVSAGISMRDGEREIFLGFQHAQFSWSPDDVPVPGALAASQPRDLHFQFPAGKLNVVVGPTGSEKTSTLLALLGEMRLVGGKLFFPSSGNSRLVQLDSDAAFSDGCAYVAQTAWLLNATIRDNILFYMLCDEKHYRHVLDICALQRDMGQMRAGDATVIGENGVTLDRLRRALAMVPQDPSLLAGSVRSNLDPLQEPSDAEVDAVLRRVKLLEEPVPTPPWRRPGAPLLGHARGGGPPALPPAARLDADTTVAPGKRGRGESFAGTARARVCGARGSRVRVLDAAADEQVQAAVRALAGDGENTTTVIAIAHRLATFADYDTALVLDAGRNVEHGPPWRLLRDSRGALPSRRPERGCWWMWMCNFISTACFLMPIFIDSMESFIYPLFKCFPCASYVLPASSTSMFLNYLSRVLFEALVLVFISHSAFSGSRSR